MSSKSSLVLTAGEEIIAVVEGEMFSTTTNLLANFFLKLIQGIYALFGYRKTGKMIVTNKRVYLESKEFTCWCCPTDGVFKSIPYSGISSVQYSFMAMCLACLCRKYVLTVTQSSGDAFGFFLRKGKESEAVGIFTAIFNQFKY